ncbi:hypothetical protein FKY93_09050 [Enterococcus faecalis]|nr:hypothetical protein D349_02743 [Enterococcus faecalis UP2S-6]MEB8140028.1 hypothetical protein [Enterococcus faecalis]TQB12102.1 hypothetical protein FKY93_09050 [Enterococcus faecalis]
MQTLNKTKLILERYVNQKMLLKELGIGYETLKVLHLQGLQIIHLGRQRLYDINDVNELLSQLKNEV